VKRALGSFIDKQVSNAAVHFVAIPYRHASVSPYLTGMRLVENMLNGGALDFYCIGRLDNQEDRVALEVVQEIYQFHKKHEKYFTGIRSDATVCLFREPWREKGGFQGFVRILAENHILFDCMEAWRLDHQDTPKPLEAYNLLVLPDIQRLSDASCHRIDEFVSNGGTVLATGYTSTKDELGNPMDRFRLKSAGIKEEFVIQKQERGTYLRITAEDKTHFSCPCFKHLDIIYVYSDFLEYDLNQNAKGLLKLIRPAMYGPPEKCYYTEVTDIPGMIVAKHGKGKFVYFPWKIGYQYNYKAHHGFTMLVMAAIRDILNHKQNLKVVSSRN